MAKATTVSGVGDTWSNVFTDDLLENFLFDQSSAPTLSAGSTLLTFHFGSDSLALQSDAGITANPIGGIINSINVLDTTITQLALPLVDILAVLNGGDVDEVNKLLWKGSDTIDGGASEDRIRGFAGNDVIHGNNGNDRISGDAGADKIFGDLGNDILFGGASNDQLSGGAGDDRLAGGSGNDRLAGDAGFDDMVGGTGADTFVFKVLSDLGPIGSSADAIGDFTRSEGDKIDVHGIDANQTLILNQDFTFIGSSAFSINTPGTLHVLSTATPGQFIVELNTDNDAQAEARFFVFGDRPVASDFIL